MSMTPRPNLYSELNYLGGAGAYVEEVYQVIKDVPLFEKFSHQEIEVLCEYMHCFASSRETVLLREGDEGDHLLLIITGRVAVRKNDPRRATPVIAMAGSGSTLGEMSLIDGAPRFADCITAEPTDFAVLTRSDLNEMLMNHPRLANKFLIKLLQIMVARLRVTNDSIQAEYVNPVL